MRDGEGDAQTIMNHMDTFIVQGIKDRNGGEVPSCVVIEITGDVRDMFTRAASEGFMSVVGQYPQWNNIDSHDRTSDLLTRHGDDVLGIYVQTPDIMGPSAVEAVIAAGRTPSDYAINMGEPVPQLGDVLVNDEALWSPAQVLESPWADGLYIEMQAPMVPIEVGVDDPRLWENRLNHLW